MSVSPTVCWVHISNYHNDTSHRLMYQTEYRWLPVRTNVVERLIEEVREFLGQ